jgi:hypothetical protein
MKPVHIFTPSLFKINSNVILPLIPLFLHSAVGISQPVVTRLWAEISRSFSYPKSPGQACRMPSPLWKGKFLQRVKRPDPVAVPTLRMWGIISPHACVSQCLTTHRATFHLISFKFLPKILLEYILDPMHRKVIMLALTLIFPCRV